MAYSSKYTENSAHTFALREKKETCLLLNGLPGLCGSVHMMLVVRTSSLFVLPVKYTRSYGVLFVMFWFIICPHQLFKASAKWLACDGKR